MLKKLFISFVVFIALFQIGAFFSSAQAVACNTNSDCSSTQYCYQPPMPICPAGMACIQVMPAKYCADIATSCPRDPSTGNPICPVWDPMPGYCSDGTLVDGGVSECGCSQPPTCQYNSPRPTATPAPEGCHYQQVQCFRAPCDPILVCNSPAPSPSPLPTPITNCQTDADCSDNELCYQPPMPPCPDGMACAQVMPAKYCQVQGVIVLGDQLPTQLTPIDISTTSRYPTNFQLNNTHPKVQSPEGEIGYAMLFKFEGQQGKNLETLVTELSINNVGSFVRTHLYGPDKKMITSADTRIQLTVSQAGTFYLVAQTFGEKQGDIAVQVYDRDEQKLKGTLFGQSLGSVFPPQILPTYSQNILNIGRTSFHLILEFPDTVTLQDNGVVEYFSKEAAKTMKVRPTLYRSSGTDIVSLVTSRANIAPLEVTLTKESDKVILIRPKNMVLFKPGYYYGFISDVIYDQPGVSGMNFYTYFAAISTSGKVADLNNDGKVNIMDFTILSQEFMQNADQLQADINNDGKVNLMDYTLLSTDFSIN